MTSMSVGRYQGNLSADAGFQCDKFPTLKYMFNGTYLKTKVSKVFDGTSFYPMHITAEY
jgi:hypothetical protein